ncbi:MAG: beta strand repeat-containing protein [Thermoanaerobaculia bacterium]
MNVNALKRSIAVAVFLLCLLASAPLRAQLACNSPAQGFSTGVPAGWSVVDNAGQGVVWGNLAACGEAANYTGGAGDAACVSSDHAGQHEFDTELRSPVFSLAGATSASLDFNTSYQNFAGSDFLDIDISTNGGTSWVTLVRWNEDHGAFRATPGEAARIDLSPFLGMSNLMLRWRYYDPNTNDWDWYAQLDDVKLTCPVCAGTQRPDPTADGSFEAGSPSAVWTEASTNFGSPLCSPATCGLTGARTGDWWAFFGGVAGAAETASLEQTVVLGTGAANLTFYLWNPESSGNGTDALRVKVDGTQVLSIPAGNAIYAAGYTRVVVDLSAYADGGSHTIRFESSTSGAPGNSNFFVDDVSISICVPPPTALAAGDASVTEGTGGTSNLTFTVTLAPVSASTVTVDYATADGTATAPADYTAASGTLTFLPGETSKTVTVPVNGDSIDELDETLALNLTNAINATIADNQGTGTIVDDDTSAASIGNASVAEGNSGSVAAAFAVTLSVPNSRTVTVDYQTANGTATAGADYTAASGTVTFAPGETAKTVSVPVLGDVIDEADETFTVTLSSPTNAVLGSATGTGTVVDDDTATLTVSNASVTEGDTGSLNAVFTVSLTTPSSQTVTVQAVTANGTATAGSDYTATGPVTLTFAPGQTSQPFTVPVLGDTIDEADETFLVSLSNASGASISPTQGTGTGTIVDNDTSNITINDVSVTEGNSGTTLATFTVTLSTANSRTVTVDYATANGTATAGSDYVAKSGTLTFAAGTTSQTIAVTVNGDTLNEGNETFNVNLSNATNATITDAQGVGTITDDDLVSISINDVSVNEGNTGTATANFTVSLSNPSTSTITVTYQTANGTATSGSDYVAVGATVLTFAPNETTKTVTVTVNGDTLNEGNETFNVNLSLPTGGATIGDSQGVGTITDDDPVSISINDVSVLEGNSGTTPASFTVTLSNPSTSTITVTYQTANGTATSGSDYVAVPATVLTFAPNETTKTVTVNVNGDTLNEGNETFNVNLSLPTGGATIGDSQGVGTITDDDPVSISINDVSVTEGNTGTVAANFTVTLSNASTSTITVTYQTANGTATAGSDYVAVPATVLTFAPNETAKTITVNVNGDTLNEGTETFNVNLSLPTGGATISDSQGVGTILDGGDLSAITISDCSVTEGDSGTTPCNFTVTLSNASTSTITVTYQTANGTATAGSDYVAVPATVLTFTPGQTSKTVTVNVNGDTLNEGNETFNVNLSAPTGGATIADAQGVGTIADNDPVTISIDDPMAPEGNSGTSLLTFTVSLLHPSINTITVTYQTADGTATAPSDYASIPATVLTFTPGQTSKTILVTINGDTTSEGDETFKINLSLPTGGATISKPMGTGTIKNDDTPIIQVPATLTVDEGSAAEPTLTVTLSSPPSSTVTVQYATADGLALSTTDYVTTSGTLTFAPGVTSQSITLPLRRDTLPELSEAFFVNFTNPVNGAFPGGPPAPTQAQTKVTITDDDQVTWNLYGDANNTSIPGCITLSQLGSGRGAAYNFKTFNLSSKFDMLFRVGFGIYDVDGGGGMVFTLRKEGSLILGGADMGYQSITPSVGVEMDTDPQWIADPEYDHIAVDENGATSSHAAGPVQASATSANIEDGYEHTFRVTRDPVYNQINAYFDGSLRLSYYRDIANTLYGGTQATYFGMTGASNCNNSVCPNNVVYFCPVAICIGDSATPQLQVEDLQVSEGNTGNQTATFKVNLYCPRNELITVNYATANGTATAGLDYLAASGSLVFNPGETQKTVSVTVYPDTTTEADETFALNLSSPSVNVAVARQGTATIIDDVRFGYGQAGDVPLWGDWDGNGTATPGVWRNGTFYLRNSLSSGAADITVNLGGAGDQPVVGDWTGTHVTRVGIFNGAFFYLKTANTTAASTINLAFGQSGDRPLAGDWNGDGVDTIGVQRGSAFYLRNSNTNGGADISFSYGLSTDVGIAGDWNGDGIDTVGVFRNGTFYLRNSNTSGVADVTLVYGAFGDIPLAGDMDGDHKDNVGFFRSSNATFYLRK